MENKVSAEEPFQEFLERIQQRLKLIYNQDGAIQKNAAQRGLEEGVWRRIMETRPLSVAVPREYGGRGALIHENLALLEAAAYESLALSLTFGINMGLFLQPVGKYANPEAKSMIFKRFLEKSALGGLMITEPGFGSDALNMQTFYTQEGEYFHLKGKKHWAGLTGWADYWLLTARKKNEDGELHRDIDFFICDVTRNEQKIEVEEYFDNLGLYQIPYGRNHIDVKIPGTMRLQAQTTGIKMMLDLLHRSRLQFPGMGAGFLKRMLDEAIAHTQQRMVGGKSLFHYDQVQERLSKMQAYFTISSAMCAHSVSIASVDKDLAGNGPEANAIKTLITDHMQEAAQSLTQLIGAKAYRLSHIAGRSIADSRPFQIFEGSNDILYAQISDSFIRQMKKIKESNLFSFTKNHPLTCLSADRLKEYFNFNIDFQISQRKLVELGKVIARTISMDMVYKLSAHGFRDDLISGGLNTLQQEIHQLMSSFGYAQKDRVVEDYQENSSWLSLVKS